MDHRIIDEARHYAREIGERLGLHEAYLYGSQARGTAGAYSDVDIAFVYNGAVDDIEQFYLTYGELYSIAAGYDTNIEPVLLERNDDFFLTVQKDGIRLQ